ncbi:uncharacterized protein LOC125055673 isoform X1 [Pieris napi]|uniref:uncharacterized protein LOC125055673 isoform X1 n=2 Tax=Pieris napi TaxID=78633 RepID=UPI001FB99151|nr:uncharacterized protein LOC125055673 isoform X1 [Pieris napi]
MRQSVYCLTRGNTTIARGIITVMELVSFGKELLHEAAEVAASYRVGQSALRFVDKALWTVEKSARWAVPPPLEQDERQPELIRPLPWVFFLMLLVALRVIRESISLINLVLGKPPLRSADVVIYIQGKRRYLRTLKYQGSRMMRARSEPKSWRSGIYSLFEFTMCFRNSHCPNNNSQSSGDELVMVSRNEPSMERLLEKMVQVEADTDDASETEDYCSIVSAANTRSDAEMTEATLDKSFEDSREEIVTSTPEKRDSSPVHGDVSGIENARLESVRDFGRHERNGPNPAHKIANGRPAHASPSRERIAGGDLIY